MVPALGRTALLITLAALAALAVFVVADHYAYTVDSIYVLQGASAIVKCFDAGLIPHCAAGIWDYSFFPLAQYVPSIALNSLALGGDLGLHALTWINYVAFLALVGISWAVVAPRTGRAAAALAVVALVSSPLLFYADGAWGEPLAALLVLLFAASVVTDAPLWIVGMTLVFAGTTKDVAPPLLLLLGGVALLPRWHDIEPGPRRRLVITLLGSAAVAIAVDAAFNYFRFGELVNHVYGSAASSRIDLGFWPQHFLAALISPNAGIVEGWPIALALIAGVAAAGRRRASGPLVLLTLVLVGFSAYYAPFGWYAWLNRFCVPWVPAILLVALTAYRDAARASVAAVTSRVAIVGVVAVVAFASQAGAVAAGQNTSFAWLFHSDSECRSLSELDAASKTYLECQMHIAWERTPVTLKGLEAVVKPRSLPLAILGSLSCLTLCLYARREVRLSRESGPRP